MEVNVQFFSKLQVYEFFYSQFPQGSYERAIIFALLPFKAKFTVKNTAFINHCHSLCGEFSLEDCIVKKEYSPDE